MGIIADVRRDYDLPPKIHFGSGQASSQRSETTVLARGKSERLSSAMDESSISANLDSTRSEMIELASQNCHATAHAVNSRATLDFLPSLQLRVIWAS